MGELIALSGRKHGAERHVTIVKHDHILAIDQGTTGSTALVYRRDGRPIGRGYEELPQIFPKPGWVAHDPSEILRTSLTAIRRALDRARITGRQIAAIGVTNQRETTVVWDRRSGRPVADAIVWQCRRTAPMCETLQRRGAAALVRRRTGLVLDPYFSGTKVRWLLDHAARVRRRVRAGGLAFGTVDTWLLWSLTGGRVHATDYTNASRTLLFNIHTRRWDDELLRLFGVPSSILPEVHPSAHTFGTTIRIGPLPAGIPIAGIAGDQQAALFGHGCITPGSAKNTYGTGCFLLLQTGARCITSRHGLITTIACGERGQPTYALEGSVFIAGAAVQWLRDGLRMIRRAEETEALASSASDAGGVHFVPAFVGLGAPYWDAGARGAILGLTRGTGRAAIARACLESIAFQTGDVMQAMEADSRLRLRSLRVDGGATQNAFLMQFQADLLGVPVMRPASVEYTARGAALLAGMTTGMWDGVRVLERWDAPPTRFRPRVATAVRRRWYAGWRDAVQRVRTAGSTNR